MLLCCMDKKKREREREGEEKAKEREREREREDSRPCGIVVEHLAFGSAADSSPRIDSPLLQGASRNTGKAQCNADGARAKKETESEKMMERVEMMMR